MRDSIIMVFDKWKATAEEFKDVCPENMWLPLSLIFASNVGAHITQKYSVVLLQTNDSHFIVGDQPVVNTYSTFNMLSQPTDVELFYPITPYKALLLTTDPIYKPFFYIKRNLKMPIFQGKPALYKTFYL